MRNAIAAIVTVALAVGALVAAPVEPARPAGPDAPLAVPEPDVMRRPTDNAALDRFLREFAGKVEGGDGQWGFEFRGTRMMMFSDATHNRMRIIAPVGDATKLDKTELMLMLQANFDRALDAKYAIYKDVVWSTYVHPLGELTHSEFESALKQVETLRATYGTTYTSTELMFGAGENLQKQEDE